MTPEFNFLLQNIAVRIQAEAMDWHEAEDPTAYELICAHLQAVVITVAADCLEYGDIARRYDLTLRDCPVCHGDGVVPCPFVDRKILVPCTCCEQRIRELASPLRARRLMVYLQRLQERGVLA